jgi:hypothetical protein
LIDIEVAFTPVWCAAGRGFTQSRNHHCAKASLLHGLDDLRTFSMKKTPFLAATVFSLALLTGCAGGRTPLDYETGTYVTPETVQQLKSSSATQDRVVQQIGHPNSKSELSGKEIWKYDYNLITAIPGVPNKNESTVFEWSKAGKLLDAYKTNGGSGSSSNPLLKAAGM